MYDIFMLGLSLK